MSQGSTTQEELSSPSPTTPGSPDLAHPFDSQDRRSIHNWHPFTANFSSIGKQYEQSAMDGMATVKQDEPQMLRLDDLLEHHVFEDPSSLHFHSNPSITYAAHPISPLLSTLNTAGLASSIHTVHPITKPIPPPVTVARKSESASTSHKVIRPPQDTCYNLPIMFPGMREGVTKSRVETQVRITLDLADPASSSDPRNYNRIGSWKWLRLPQGTATKRRPRKQPKMEHKPEDTLALSCAVTCATPPHNPVLSCTGCQAREAKRVAKKLAARVRPARSDSESCDESSKDKSLKAKYVEDTTSIIQFNCSEVVDFSAGTISLPLRVTCYCRHHREKLGFHIHFTLLDHTGRIVGAGTTQPIMITDDHKTTSNTRHNGFPSAFSNMEYEWSQDGPPILTEDARAPSKRKKEFATSRRKPYDTSAKPSRVVSRETSVSSVPSPSSACVVLPTTRSPSPPLPLSPLTDQSVPTALPSLQYSSHDSESSSDSILTQQVLDQPMFDVAEQPEYHPACSPTQIPLQAVSSHPHPLPFVFFDTNGVQSSQSIIAPSIHRLIPNCGPTHGGIEVTVLGANFHLNMDLKCIFGGVSATLTQRWSDNALVCILPPRMKAEVVAVWFDGFKSEEPPGSPPILFTYSDESDRALMELALQVVGLKMTGKIEDAKNVAMRIVGSAGENMSQNNHIVPNGINHTTRDLDPLLLNERTGIDDFESRVIKLLDIMNLNMDAYPTSTTVQEALNYQNPSGQHTLLHLAAFLGFKTLVRFLVDHGCDLDLRDRNGFTALHFAAFSDSPECAKILISGGADLEIVNNAGKLAREIGLDAFFEEELAGTDTASDLEDEEVHWGDGEEDASEPIKRLPQSGRKTHRHANPRPSKSVSPSTVSDTKIPSTEVDVDEKHRAWFVEILQRTFAQLPGAGQLPLPALPKYLPIPNLPEIVPWGAIPQLPIVLPVFIPMMPGWSGKGKEPEAGSAEETNGTPDALQTGPIKTTQDWRTMWEKWFALANASNARTESESPPPLYTARAEDDPHSQQAPSKGGTSLRAKQDSAHALGSSLTRRAIKRTAFEVETDQSSDVGAYTYQAPPQQKKHDKMLIVFWIPILFISFVWAMHNGLLFIFQSVKTSLPQGLKTIFRA